MNELIGHVFGHVFACCELFEVVCCCFLANNSQRLFFCSLSLVCYFYVIVSQLKIYSR
eukprot:m.37152 g.37152  ORF g.37152 m.37152 type:complete len:58 (+) comp10136_c0_seq3:651-824(+)